MFENLLGKLSDALNKSNIPYAIIGGMAILIYGRARHTNDIDIILGSNLSNIYKIKNICRELGLINLKENDDDFIKRTMVLPASDPESYFRVDFIFSFTEFERNTISRAIDVKLGDKIIKYASLEDLVVFKIFSGRPIDIQDVKNMLLKNPGYDIKYIMEWLAKFEAGSEIKYTEVLNQIIKDL